MTMKDWELIAIYDAAFDKCDNDPDDRISPKCRGVNAVVKAVTEQNTAVVDAAIKEVLDNERDDEAFEYAQRIANEIRKRLVR